MWLYVGWAFIALAGIVTAYLIWKSGGSQEEMNTHILLILAVAGSWVVGCLIVGHQQHTDGYLYVVNTLASGKFITTIFTGRPWR